MKNLKVKIKLFDGGKLPEYKREGDVCLDCYSRCEKPIEIKPKERALIPLGFALELPEGWEAVIRPRSGMSKSSVDSLIGTIDTNYRGELCAILWNNSGVAISVENETRVCQLAIREVPHVEWELADELSETKRGICGFGSTGR